MNRRQGTALSAQVVSIVRRPYNSVNVSIIIQGKKSFKKYLKCYHTYGDVKAVPERLLLDTREKKRLIYFRL